jgi:hypothetical protein
MTPGATVEVPRLRSLLVHGLKPPEPGRYVVERVGLSGLVLWLRGMDGCVMASAVREVEP